MPTARDITNWRRRLRLRRRIAVDDLAALRAEREQINTQTAKGRKQAEELDRYITAAVNRQTEMQNASQGLFTYEAMAAAGLLKHDLKQVAQEQS